MIIKLLKKIQNLLYYISRGCETLDEKIDNKIWDIKYGKNPPHPSEMFSCKKMISSKIEFRRYDNLPKVEIPLSETWDFINFPQKTDEEGESDER